MTLGGVEKIISKPSHDINFEHIKKQHNIYYHDNLKETIPNKIFQISNYIEQIQTEQELKYENPNSQTLDCYEILKSLKTLSENDKILLTDLFEEDRVNLAIEYFKEEKVNTTWIQALRWHCQEVVPPLTKSQRKKINLENAKENYAFSLEFYKKNKLSTKFFDWKNESCSLIITNPRSNEIEEIPGYENPQVFKQRVESAFMKYGSEIKRPEKASN